MCNSKELFMDVSEFLNCIDRYKNTSKPLPLIRGVLKEQKNKTYKYLCLEDVNNDNFIKVKFNENFEIKYLNKTIITCNELHKENNFDKLKIIHFMFYDALSEKNNFQKLQKQIVIEERNLSKIGILTSEKSDVYHDILDCLKKSKYSDYEFFYVQTQGYPAIIDICEKIKDINDKQNVNIILLSRGGGDFEEINKVFNSKDLVKSITNSKIPIITGIGHKPNTTFSDIVAFDNFITPAIAIQEIINLIQNNENKLEKIINQIEKAQIKKIYVEFSNNDYIENIYDEKEETIILNPKLFIELLNKHKFKIYLLYDEEIQSNLNFYKKLLYLNQEEIFNNINIRLRYFSTNVHYTNYNQNKKILFINVINLYYEEKKEIILEDEFLEDDLFF